MIDLGFLRDLVILLCLSLGIVLVFQRLRQPSVVGFLAAGVILGPHGVSLVKETGQVEVLAEVGVILLLFTLGLEFSLATLSQLRRQVLLGGGLQIGLTVLLIWTAAAASGEPWRRALFLGCLFALSSTVIVVKLLMERGEVDSPHGRAALGILLLQDLTVVPMMLAIPILAGADTTPPAGIVLALAKAAAVVAVVLVAARWFVPRFLAAVVRTRSRELFVLTVVLVCLGIAWATSRVGLSLALGAFLAGVAVSESEYGAQALADVLPLRDTFSSLFFISVGMLLDLGGVARAPLFMAAAILSVLAAKLFTGVVSVGALGLGVRTAILGGAAVAQVGEFSFVLAQAGLGMRLIDDRIYQTFLAVAVTTMLLTPFLMAGSGPLARRSTVLRLPAWLSRSEGRATEEPLPLRDHVVIAGYGLNGRNLARVLREVEIPYVVVEMNPEVVWDGRAGGERIQYGDITRIEVLEHLRLGSARALVIAISDPPSTRRVVAMAHARWPRLHIIARTRYLAEVEELHRLGAREVVPEEFETSVEIFSRVLASYDVPRRLISQQIEQVRREHYAVWRDSDIHTHRLERLRSMLAGLDVDTYRITETSAAKGLTLRSLNLRQETGVTVLALVREGVTLPNPGADTRVEVGDVLVFLGTNDQIERAAALLESGANSGAS
jgi:CPA2 family monovalent cation:H+ antiporter-2